MNFPPHYSRISRVLLGIAVALAGATSALAQRTEVVALSGDPVPDGNGVIASFIADSFPGDAGSGPSFNDAGQTVFTLFLKDTAGGETDASGLFMYDGHRLVLLARQGQTSPDGNGELNLFNNSLMPALNNGGVTTFSWFLNNSASGNDLESGLFLNDATGNDLALFRRQDDPSPDGNGPIQYLYQAALSDSGLMSFTGVLSDPDPLDRSAAFRADIATGQISLLARKDQGVPGGNGVFGILNTGSINENGQLSLWGGIRGSTVAVNDAATYRVDPDGAFDKVVRVGDPSPDSDEVVNEFDGVGGPNASGEIAFVAGLAAGVDTASTSSGIFVFDGTKLTPRVRSGQVGPDNGVFTGVFGAPTYLPGTITPLQLNDHGQIGFYGFTIGNGLLRGGIYRADRSGQIVRAVRAGQPAPDGDGTFLLNSVGFVDSNDPSRS